MSSKRRNRSDVFARAFKSRCIIILGVILSYNIIPDFDPGHDVVPFIPFRDVRDHWGVALVGGFTRWDAARFLNLAWDPKIRSNVYHLGDGYPERKGREGTGHYYLGRNIVLDEILQHSTVRNSVLSYFPKVYYERRWHKLIQAEEAHAFFPLWPNTIRFFSSKLFASHSNSKILEATFYVAAAIAVNICYFCLAAICLDELCNDLLLYYTRQNVNLPANLNSTLYFTENELLEAVNYFIWNPANVFFVGCYSESSFSFLTFAGYMFHTKSINSNSLKMIFLYQTLVLLTFVLSGLTRSNGFFCVGYFVIYIIMIAIQRLNGNANLRRAAHFICCLSSVVLLYPMWSHNCSGYYHLCTKAVHSREYCKSSPKFDVFNISTIYSFVQKKHWGVGAFRFYALKQTPNFLLASPIIFITVCVGLIHLSYLKNQIFRSNLKTSLLRWSSDIILAHSSVLAVSLLVCLVFAHIHITTR